jgi:putative Ca2+/H+ antiporter (TMEM165/GDT1 family)
MLKLNAVILTFLITLIAEAGCAARTWALGERFGSAASACLGTLAANALLLVPVLLGSAWLDRHISRALMLLLSALIFGAMGISLLIQWARATGGRHA